MTAPNALESLAPWESHTRELVAFMLSMRRKSMRGDAEKRDIGEILAGLRTLVR
jgi:hypothetical protein